MRQRFLRSFPTLGHYMEQAACFRCIRPASPLYLPTSPLHRFPTLGRRMGQIKATARRQGKAFTVGGRMRPLPHIASTNRDEQAKAERQVVASPVSPMYLPCISPCVPLYLPMPPHTCQVVNSTIQGSAADVMKDAMLRCRAELHRRRLPALLLAQALLRVRARARARVRVRVRVRARVRARARVRR